jgi:uncharacterized hydrophobic protein (TIGR00271 family)
MTDATPPGEKSRRSDPKHGGRVVKPGEKKVRTSLTPERRREILQQLFYEGAARGPFVRQFYALLALSTVIATIGLLLDSTAVVIGAMLLSPLMTPMLAIAGAIVMGWPARAARNMLRVALATLYVFAIAYVLPLLAGLPPETDLSGDTSREILARTNPNVGDLMIALCAGTAAAYMLVRKEALSALPGVAIAVALVPPLCVSGVLAFLGAWDLAWEAFVLYATNLTAIVLMAGVVLLLMGFKPNVRDQKREVRVAGGFALVVALVLLIALPLAFRAVADLQDLHDRIVAARIIDEWIGENDVELLSLAVEDDVFSVSVRVYIPIETLREVAPRSPFGHLDDAMTPDALDAQLTAALGKPVEVRLSGDFGFTRRSCRDSEPCAR